MLNENIKTIRKAKGLSQEDLAARLHVVRQTISKWEQGLSVPDADLLIALAEALETPVSTLLGETVSPPGVDTADDLKVLSDKLEKINYQLAQRTIARRKLLHWLMIFLCIGIAVTFACLIAAKSPYLNWNYHDPETAVAGAAFHAFEYLFVRIAPFAWVGAIFGAVLTRKKG